MIPRWQWAVIILMLMGVFALAIFDTPGSYAHMFLTGRCFESPKPAVCVHHGRHIGGWR